MKKRINILLAVFLGIWMAAYYKIKVWIAGRITFQQIFGSELYVNTTFAVLLALAIIYGHQWCFKLLQKKFPHNTKPLKRFLILLSVTSLASVITSLVFIYVFWGLIFGISISSGMLFDFIVFALFMPLIVNGITEAVYYYGEWQSEALKKEQLEKENLKAQLEVLKNQINPHFLFNSFNTLSELIMESEKVASRFLQQLSNVYRFVLENRNIELIELEKELSVFESYVYLQEIRFGKNLHIQIDIQKKHLYSFIPPLTLQILLENVLKHNVFSAEQPLDIKVMSNDMNKLIFQNSLQKKQTQASTKVGLQNIMNRYKHLSNMNIEIKESATDFEVVIPLLSAEYL